MSFDSKTRPEPQADGLQTGKRQRALSILVVEDNQDAAELMAAILEFEGCLVQVASDGVSAIAAAQKSVPDAILLDIGLPGMSGYELAQKLRGIEALRNTTLIAVTGYAPDEDRFRAAQSGFSHHLVKPVEMDVLRRILAQLSAAL